MYEMMMSGSMFGLFLQVVPITCLTSLVYGILRYWYVRKRGNSIVWNTELVRLVFVCYLAGLLNLVLVPSNLWSGIWFYVRNGYSGGTVGPMFEFSFNLVPTLYRYLIGEMTLGGWVMAMLVGNVLMFVPMGVLLPFVSKRWTARVLVPAALVIPVMIELLQPIVGRSFDVDDLLGNLMGIVLGYLVAALIKLLIKGLHRA